MSSDVNQVDLLTFALSEQRTIMTDPTNSVTVELTADGSIKAIRLTESGHRMTPTMVAELVMSLHTAGLAQAQLAIEAALFSDAGDGLTDQSAVSQPAAPAATPSALSNHLPAVEVSPEGLAEELGLQASPATGGDRYVAAPTDDSPRLVSAPGGARTHHDGANFVAPQPAGAKSRPDELVDEDEDEDEYFRNFSVFERDDHRPRATGLG
ncbi:hypothetical protein [Nocardia sp. NPDC058480]|uniref:hypothetical protein n=1 Tax=Nocardia sp. NPDC058480 TaxID=3346522 RepID=UPI00364CC4B9